MTENFCTPKFLTKEIAHRATLTALDVIYASPLRLELQPTRGQLHVVVLVPGMKDDRPDYSEWPNYQIQPVALYEHTLGNAKDFPYPFIEISRCKAIQLWHDRNDDRTDIVPHLLFPGDAPFWGGVKRRGIVVACSGIQPWLDKLVSGMVADLIVALTHNSWMGSDDRADDERCFLS
ncbi:MAG: hypothetical protein A2408_03040 [Candidatus Yonathbacteria bacterium RIFOXYC1_FULL_52_10]|uniref:Uncharacterized protein n=1 Tax=Candidatus Yonathbacteria bacterium RIFOXYD1_FULL_52_36 TaxID=1802730 RepID=A0A1G2SHZ4_9BACT|nr:MAG: hypothetical protein A2408_03040 [Candidatus Yonathbacteria bacterium RIFOXYC1_FULL_52_10]OHA84655.1 MAG: hypothetical protein A2591_02940 [Candidatus Yonathbacteria bacterium RIFOXYD1_FULL_52_36]